MYATYRSGTDVALQGVQIRRCGERHGELPLLRSPTGAAVSGGLLLASARFCRALNDSGPNDVGRSLPRWIQAPHVLGRRRDST
jgi:hypothetical protein